jgi:hypothetical protein
MATEVSVDGERFLINGKPTYEGVTYRGRSVEGLLLNSRMIQAIIDDENPETRKLWVYPDTGVWDPERNTNEFCAMLPEYRRHGLLAVTVGLQGGGSSYLREVWEGCHFSAFREDGSLAPDYLARLARVLDAADACGMVVIVNLFYWKQVNRIRTDAALVKAVEHTMDFLLKTDKRNLLIDVANESADWWQRDLCKPHRVVTLIEAARSVTLSGRRLLVGTSTGGDNLPTEPWLEAEDVSLPHGNGNTPTELRERLHRLRAMDAFKKRPRPLLINEDGVDLDNFEAAVSEYASWGYYAQGAGSGSAPYDQIWPGDREKTLGALSGFQTLPVNWGINTEDKRAFFAKVAEITGS